MPAVISAGAGATRFKPGDAVYVRASRDTIGTFAEQIALPEKFIALKPATISHAEAASLPLVGLTTLQGFGRAGARAGQRILIHAGSGGVGTFAVQYAKHLGLHVTSTTSSRNADFVKSLGADRVIAYDRENYLEQGGGYDIVYDTLGGAAYCWFFTESNGDQLRDIAALVDSGAIKPVIDREFAFEKLPEALAYLEAGRARGKVVLKVR